MATFTILEPMSTGDVIDRAVRLYRRNFTPLVSIVALPTLIGWIVSMMFWYGYTSLLASASGQRSFPLSAIWMLALGGMGYPVWGFLLLLTVSGLTRVVGDHVMLGERITFRGCISAVRRRFGAITLMGLLSMALVLAAYIVVSIVLVVLILVVGLLVGVIAAARLPQWIATTAVVITVIVAVAFFILLILVVAARVAFLPQSVMIEGESAGSALGRAMRLGKGNWYRVGAIVLFTYFVSLSLQSALMMPVVIGLYLSGALTAEFFFSPLWSILYTSFRDVSNLLSFPISIVSFTLLYFDSRVRKEAYDVDLLAREINPGFYWQPPAQPSVLGFQMPVQFSGAREYVQTSPLGLAGYRPVTSTASGEQPDQSPGSAEEPSEKFEVAENLAGEHAATCKACGATLMPNARFCMTCGSEV
ncbi:MAG TPA: hypothetical protein VLM38_14565 [Blastocatellia bacterium]|nr:hypothetical protein [Blastocatellia bacterium]